MKFKKIFQKARAVILTAAVLFILYVSLIFLLVFVPSFTRCEPPTEEQNKKHFVEDDYFSRYEREKEWFWNSRPEVLSVDSFDSLKLSAYMLRAEGKENGTVLLIHGYHSEPVREFAAIARFYHNAGYNVILPFQRSHGASEGKFITFGVKERFDVLSWTEKSNEIFGNEKPLFLHGISMGCASVLMSLELDLPKNVRGVVADCGFTTPREIIWKVLSRDKKLPTANFIMKIGDFFARHLADFSFDGASTLDAIEKNKKREEQIPILFFHGGKDDFVPIDMTGKNFMMAAGSFVAVSGSSFEFVPNAQAEKYKFVQIDEAPHAISFFVDEARYCEELSDFLEKYKKKE